MERSHLLGCASGVEPCEISASRHTSGSQTSTPNSAAPEKLQENFPGLAGKTILKTRPWSNGTGYSWYFLEISTRIPRESQGLPDGIRRPDEFRNALWRSLEDGRHLRVRGCHRLIDFVMYRKPQKDRTDSSHVILYHQFISIESRILQGNEVAEFWNRFQRVWTVSLTDLLCQFPLGSYIGHLNFQLWMPGCKAHTSHMRSLVWSSRCFTWSSCAFWLGPAPGMILAGSKWQGLPSGELT